MERNGSIEVICGPMFAGKSEEIIRRIRRIEYAKKKVICFKPGIDNRYSPDEIVSHNMTKKKSYVISSSKDILKYLDDDVYAVVIDEVQFLDHDIVSLCEQLANKGIRVIVGGLDLDFRGEPFSVTMELLARAEKVTKLTAICVKCGNEATRTQRIVNGFPAFYEEEIISVGAKEKYEPRCRFCHEVYHKADFMKEIKGQL